MYAPTKDNEITGLVNYIDQQLEAIRSSAYGLTEEQVRERPCRSALSIGGIVKHALWVMRSGVGLLANGPRTGPLTEEGFAEFNGSFALTAEESMEGLLGEFDQAREEYLAAVGRTDPDAEALAAPAPWSGIFDARPIRQRYWISHQIEELARHAGHADIIREQLDGQQVPGLVMTRAGAPANDFFKPFEAPAGSLVA